MSAVLVQIELPGGRSRDYETLAHLMDRSGWHKRLTGDDGRTHTLAHGTFVGNHQDIGKLAVGLRMKIRDSGLHNSLIILTAVLQDWTAVG